MAYAVELTLGTGNKVSLNYQSEEVSVSITYKLEREDVDVLEIVECKTPELVEAHRLAWEQVRGAKTPRIPAPRAKNTQDIASEESTASEVASAPMGAELASSDEPEAQVEETLQAEESLEAVTTREKSTPITPAQVQVVLAVACALGLDEKALKDRLSLHAGESVLESLTHAQAAALIVELSRERREQLDRERNGSG